MVKYTKKNNKSSNKKIKSNNTRLKVRLITNFILFILFLILTIFLLNNSIYYKSEKKIKFSEFSNLDYKVYLKENEFYENEYLSEDMIYIANLIDKINIDFNYNYEIEKNMSIEFDYNIIAKLVISDTAGKKNYFEKEYVLLENKQISDLNVKNITEKISLDYPYYNSLANKFKNSYGIDTDSKLIVYMTINTKNEKYINNNSVMNIIIPLSEKSVEIKLDYHEIDKTRDIIIEKSAIVTNYLYIFLAFISMILTMMFSIKTIRRIAKLRNRKSKYVKYINKILKEYDRLIVEVSNVVLFEDKEIIELKKFSELLDVHDNLQLPIMYHKITEPAKSYFYILHNNIIYLNVVKSTEFESKNEKKNKYSKKN